MSQRVKLENRFNISILTEKYKNKIYLKTNGEFELVSDYNDKVITIRHLECGRESELNPKYFLSKLSCPQCAKEERYLKRLEKTKKIISEFKEELKKEVGEDYIVTSDYMNPDERKVSLKHKCGYEYKIKINSFRSGRRCPICTKTQPKPPEQYEKEFKIIVKDKFELLSEYERANKKIEVLCTRCNSKSLVNPSSFLRDSRCPKCEKKQVLKK